MAKMNLEKTPYLRIHLSGSKHTRLRIRSFLDRYWTLLSEEGRPPDQGHRYDLYSSRGWRFPGEKTYTIMVIDVRRRVRLTRRVAYNNNDSINNKYVYVYVYRRACLVKALLRCTVGQTYAGDDSAPRSSLVVRPLLLYFFLLLDSTHTGEDDFRVIYELVSPLVRSFGNRKKTKTM